MRFLSLLFLLTLLFSCKSEPKKEIVKSQLKKPSFLIGNWLRLNNKPNTTAYENWTKDFEGLGVTLKEKDTVFKETMSFEAIKDTLYLKVEGVNADATLFKITKQNDTSFTAENPKNEFPKTIKYWLESEQLKAKVANGEFAIDFVFEKMK